MAPQLLVPAIHPRDTNWRAIVLVLEKGNIAVTKNTKRLQKMVLMDSEGNRVLGLLWDGCVDLFHNSLLPFKTYCIGGASVTPIKDEYLKNSPGVTLQWTISKSTYISPVKAPEEHIAYPKLPYVSCTDMIASVGTETRIDFFAVVLDVKQPQQKMVRGKATQLQECTVMQQELRPIILTMWGNFLDVQGIELFDKKDNYPILLAKNIIASDYTGLALATTPASFIAIDPDLPQAAEFRTWVSEHTVLLKNMERTPTRETFQSLYAFSSNEPIVLISEIIPDTKNVWVKVQITIEKTKQQLTYTSCPKCMSTITAEPDESYFCFNCQCHQTAKLRCKLTASMTDASDTVMVTMFDSIAENILKKNSSEIHKMDEQETHALLCNTNTRLADITITAQVRAQRKRFEDNKTRYSIQQLHFESPNEKQQQPPQTIRAETVQQKRAGNAGKRSQNNEETENSSNAQQPPQTFRAETVQDKTSDKAQKIAQTDQDTEESSNAEKTDAQEKDRNAESLAPVTPVKKPKLDNM